MSERMISTTDHPQTSKESIPPWARRAVLLSPYASIAVISIGILTLIGWQINSTLLTSLLPNTGAMNPITAIGFICAGYALWIPQNQSRDPHPGYRSIICATAVIAIGLLSIAGYIFDNQFGIDHLLFSEKLHGNRIPPNTALTFLLIGYSLLTITRDKHITVQDQMIVAFAGLIAFLTIIGYLYKLTALTSVATFTPMDVNTAISFIILCIGTLCARPREGIMHVLTDNTLGGEIARRLLPAAMLLPFFLGWIHLLGSQAESYNNTFGISILIIPSTVIFSILVWWNASTLSHQEEDLKSYQEHLKDQNRRLAQLNEQIAQEIHNTKKFQQAVEASTNALSLAFPDLTYLYVNPAWERLTGYSKADVLNPQSHMQMTSRINKKTPSHITQQLLDAAYAGKNFTSEEMIYNRKDGSEYNAAVTLYPVFQEGRVALYVVVHDNITQRKRVEAAQSSFVSLASHQLRTPITALRLALDTLKNGIVGPLSPEQESLIHRATEYAVHMAETINMLLSVARLEAGKLHPEKANIHLSTLLGELVDEYRIEQERKHLSFSVSCPENLSLSTDPKILKEIIANLLSNAINYTPPQGSVSIVAKEGTTYLHLDVQDTGYGIPKEAQQRIFQKFFRAENVVKKKADGTGLGLYLIHSLTRLLGGTITFVSEENRGTTFSLSLPLSHDTKPS